MEGMTLRTHNLNVDDYPWKVENFAIGLKGICDSLNLDVGLTPCAFSPLEYVFQPVKKVMPRYIFFEAPRLFIRVPNLTGDVGADFEALLSMISSKIFWVLERELQVTNLTYRRQISLELGWQKSFIRRPLGSLKNSAEYAEQFFLIHPEARLWEHIMAIQYVEKKRDTHRTVNPMITIYAWENPYVTPREGIYGFGLSEQERECVAIEELDRNSDASPSERVSTDSNESVELSFLSVVEDQ